MGFFYSQLGAIINATLISKFWGFLESHSLHFVIIIIEMYNEKSGNIS